MKKSHYRYLFLSLSLCAAATEAGAGPLDSAIKELYSEKPEARAAAVRALSSVSGKQEIAAVIEGFKKELACPAVKPRPSGCHNPEFVRGVLLAAGELARKDDTLPWDFLVGLASGHSSTEGSFFQDKEKLGDQDFRGDDYYSPGIKGVAAARAQLQKLLDQAVRNAGIRPTCGWPLEKVRVRGKRTQELEGYEVYSYFRDYSGEGLRDEYKVTHSMNWIYRGVELLYCGKASRVSFFGGAGPLAVFLSETGDEEPAYELEVYDLAGRKTLCSYNVAVDSTEAEKIFDLGEMGQDKLISALLALDKGLCRPKKLKGYTFTDTPRPRSASGN